MIDEQIADRYGSFVTRIESHRIVRQIKVIAYYQKAITDAGCGSGYVDHLLSPFEDRGNTPRCGICVKKEVRSLCHTFAGVNRWKSDFPIRFLPRFE
jgi:hypothetical protein